MPKDLCRYIDFGLKPQYLNKSPNCFITQVFFGLALIGGTARERIFRYPSCQRTLTVFMPRYPKTSRLWQLLKVRKYILLQTLRHHCIATTTIIYNIITLKYIIIRILTIPVLSCQWATVLRYVRALVVVCEYSIRGDQLLTMFCDVDDAILSPTEEEVTDGKTEHQRQTQPHVVRHEHQHQHVRSDRLNQMQKRLNYVPG